MKNRMFFRYALVGLLLFSRLGFALNIHYCGSSIAAIALGHTPSCGMELPASNSCDALQLTVPACCSDIMLVSSSSDAPSLEPFQLTAPLIVLQPQPQQQLLPLVFTSTATYTPLKRPPVLSLKLYLRFQQLLVYG